MQVTIDWGMQREEEGPHLSCKHLFVLKVITACTLLTPCTGATTKKTQTYCTTCRSGLMQGTHFNITLGAHAHKLVHTLNQTIVVEEKSAEVKRNKGEQNSSWGWWNVAKFHQVFQSLERKGTFSGSLSVDIQKHTKSMHSGYLWFVWLTRTIYPNRKMLFPLRDKSPSKAFLLCTVAIILLLTSYLLQTALPRLKTFHVTVHCFIHIPKDLFYPTTDSGPLQLWTETTSFSSNLLLLIPST